MSAHSLDGNQIDVALRVFAGKTLAPQTRTVRFLVGKLPFTAADNAVVVIQVPTTSPKPVIVPKDAVLPVTGALGYLAEGAEQSVKLFRLVRLLRMAS